MCCIIFNSNTPPLQLVVHNSNIRTVYTVLDLLMSRDQWSHPLLSDMMMMRQPGFGSEGFSASKDSREHCQMACNSHDRCGNWCGGFRYWLWDCSPNRAPVWLDEAFDRERFQCGSPSGAASGVVYNVSFHCSTFGVLCISIGCRQWNSGSEMSLEWAGFASGRKATNITGQSLWGTI